MVYGDPNAEAALTDRPATSQRSRSSSPVVGLVHRRSLHDDVVEKIGRSIVSGIFSEGANLPNEADLASDLGISRNVLREAVKVLVSKGMLDVRPKTGTTVRAKEQWHMLDPEVLTWEAAGDLHLPYAFNFCEFRLIVEPKASFLAAKRATDAEIQVIRNACDALEACVGHLDRMPAADIEFHQSIQRASHNALLQHLSVLTAAIMRVQVTYTANKPGDFERRLCRCTANWPRPSLQGTLHLRKASLARSARCPISISPAESTGAISADWQAIPRSLRVGRYPVSNLDVACIVDSRDAIGEGAFWCTEEQAVYWLGVLMPSAIHRYDPATKEHRSWPVPEIVTAMAKRRDGTLLVASENGLNVFDPGTGDYRHLAELEPHRPKNRSNDGAPDARGRFWIGTMQNNLGPGGFGHTDRRAVRQPVAVEPGKPPVAAMDDLSITNGVAWSPDWTKLYVVNSMLNLIYVSDFDLETGTVGPRRIFSDVQDLGTPDGNTVDAEGFLWSARWDGHCVARISPDGTIDRIVPMPASLVTSCAFGGPALDTLYVTTARLGIDEATLAKYPQQGGLFAFKPGVEGLKRPFYAG